MLKKKIEPEELRAPSAEIEIPTEEKPEEEQPLTESLEYKSSEVVTTETIIDHISDIRETEEVSTTPEISALEVTQIVPVEISQEEEKPREDVTAEVDFEALAPITSTTVDAFESLISEIEEAITEESTISVSEDIDKELKPTTTEETFEIIEEVGQKPTFVKELESVEATEGQPVRFEVVVSGEPMPEISWFLDGEIIRESPVYMIEPGPEGHCSLILPESFPEDEGEYECRATNIYGTVSTKADLYVQGKTFLSA